MGILTHVPENLKQLSDEMFFFLWNVTCGSDTEI